MSDDSVGDSRTAHVHSHTAGPDRVGLIVDVIRLTVEVMAKTSQKKDDDNKKD